MTSTERTAVHVIPANSLQSAFMAEPISTSPLGILLVSENTTSLKLGDSLDLNITVNGEQSIVAGVIVAITPETNHVLVRFYASDNTEVGLERRRGNRWICPPNLLPRAVSPSPGRFNEFLEFQVRNFSKNGLEMYVSSDADYLVPGMLLNLAVSLPLVGNTQITAKVLRTSLISLGGSEVMSIGSEFVSIHDHDRELIGQYLLQFTDIDSITEVRQIAYISTNQKVECSFVKTQSQFHKLLESLEGHGASEMTFSLDNRIAILESKSQVLAALSVTFPTSPEAVFERDETVRADETIQVSDIVIFDSHRTNFILRCLLKSIAESCITDQRQHICIRTSVLPSDDLSKFGFNSTRDGIYVAHPTSSLVGGNTTISNWSFIWESCAATLLRDNTSRLYGIHKRMHILYKILSRPARLLSFLTLRE